MKNLLTDQLKNIQAYRHIIEDIHKHEYPISVHGIIEETVAHLCYGLKNELEKPIVLITYSGLKAKKIYETLNEYDTGVAEIYPVREFIYYDLEALSLENIYQRLAFLSQMARKEPKIFIVPIESLLHKTMSKEFLLKSCKKFSVGDELSLETMADYFLSVGYERVETVEGKGQYSIRGGIIDFFSPSSENAFRIELFDTEIDSIRSFDVKNQRTICNLEACEVIPASEIIIPMARKDKYAEKLQKQIEETIEEIRDTEVQSFLSEKYLTLKEKIQENIHIHNRTLLLPLLKDEVASIIDYMDDDFTLLLDEPPRIKEVYEKCEADNLERLVDLLEKGEVLKSHFNIIEKYAKIQKKIVEQNVITLSMIAKNDRIYKPKAIYNIQCKEANVFSHKLEELSQELKKYQYRGYKILIFAGNQERGNRLEKTLLEYDISSSFIENFEGDIQSGQIIIVPKTLTKGFEYTEIKWMVLSDTDIFGTHKKKTKFKAKVGETSKIDTFADINIGDYVVHETHGIGKYVGIEKLDIQGIIKDYMKIQYSGEDKLFIPVDQMGLVQKYIGSDSLNPRVNKLNSSEWKKTKQRVKKAIEDMAGELLELYAQRKKLRGYAFGMDSSWQQEFEDAFPYEETNDQLKCIQEIKLDMESDRPMDRLLCGDVGYGKTEVALRAAFKAVTDGKQVAILVPTTILAQQHYNTISERFKDYPVRVQMLSRFRTKKQQDLIIGEVKSGEVDVIVGTHRLLSNDVNYHDLGLLIIDEEQRFGVKHKEKIKQLKQNIDVLTLTATPIPRTLHMSMIGIRDMSVIEEPPEERIPVQTYVLEKNDHVIKEAVLKELERNGQLFYVYNRVQGIESVASHIQKLVPEARVVVGHGKMGERELENVMIDFMNYEYDVLVCTTIIETGLDISNANTMIIQDADNMGLSQLYQLRGRVGRSNRVAYAYFMYEKNKSLSEIAEKRLKAIKEFTEFGSGFKIAMRDLELRGAGNVLGMEQSGHLEAIGYDLYVKYLDEAIKRLQGIEVKDEIETEIDMQVDAYIPERYIRDEFTRLEVYKKIARIKTEVQQDDMIDELIDRFGDIPIPVTNLIHIALLKEEATQAYIAKIEQKEHIVKFTFASNEKMNMEVFGGLVDLYKKRIAFDASGEMAIKLRIKHNTQKEIIDEINDFVKKLTVLLS